MVSWVDDIFYSNLILSSTGFTVKEADEIWAAMRIYEIAKASPTLRHFVWSGLDYHLKVC